MAGRAVWLACALLIGFESSAFALSSSARRALETPRPARLIKYASIRKAEPRPLGETLLDARTRAIITAPLVNRSAGGWVDPFSRRRPTASSLLLVRLFFAEFDY